MSFPSDLEIARAGKFAPLADIAAQMGIGPHLLEQHGDELAKIRLEAIDELSDRPKAKYVVVTAITPTPLGEGKTTTTVGLGQAMKHIGKKAVISLRQPSMGPTFGIKGGAAGGGYSQVIPMELLNLHLTGDFHAVTAAHNLLSAMVDNHLHQGNALDLDLHNITWRRVLDVNDRALRNIIVGLGTKMDGVPRQTGFDITAASEVMAILALSTSLADLRARMGRIVVGYNTAGEPVTAEQLKGAGSMAVIMREAIKPNLLQTLENTPVIVHAGPFGNIAHGNSSIVGDLIGIRGGDYLLTEAGFGADMGAERFFNIKCRTSGMVPDAAVLVATVRALKAHSGKFKIIAGKPLPPELLAENPDYVRAGAANLIKQIENVKVHGVSPVVAINAFPGDFASEHKAIREIAESVGARVAVCTHFAEGGRGAIDLAQAVVEACDEPSTFKFCYENDMTLKQKIEAVATKIYGAAHVTYSAAADTQLARYEKNGFGNVG
ncbi:MAG: formate--tetrahydrofolate ligase, partial [Actinomycetota bacterium]